MAQTVNNVSVGKPAIAGAISYAPVGTTLPTNATAALDEAFKNLGYISEDGLTNANSMETDEIKAWGGDIVANPQTAKPDTFTATFIEVLNIDVLKLVYGDANVSGTLADGIEVLASSAELGEVVMVVDMILKGNTLKRIVIPQAQITEIGDIVYKDDELAGYEVTLAAHPSAAIQYGTHKEYIQTAPATAGTKTTKG